MINPSNYHLCKLPYELYKIKRNKQPDYLLNMIQKSNKQKQNISYHQFDLNDRVNSSIRKSLIKKRVDNILNKMNSKKFQVSEPGKIVLKTWISPIQREIKEKKFSHEQLLVDKRKQENKILHNYQQNKQNINKILNILYLNKKMKYFGSFLSSQFDNSKHEGDNVNSRVKNTMSILNIPKTKQSKLDYLNNKFKELKKKQNPKLFILNAPNQKEKYFYNPLSDDEFFPTMMKKDDKELMRILIKTLENQGNFSLTSFSNFYEIFVWQTANKEQITKFVAKIMMGDTQQLQISVIARTIDVICEKINLSDLLTQSNDSHSKSPGIVDNFSQIMKKLLFGQDYAHAIQHQYYLTRKTLIQSLQRNEQCLSIFVNVFYM